jgi:hypothetical protein
MKYDLDDVKRWAYTCLRMHNADCKITHIKQVGNNVFILVEATGWVPRQWEKDVNTPKLMLHCVIRDDYNYVANLHTKHDIRALRKCGIETL